jgi:hypothetical protein
LYLDASVNDSGLEGFNANRRDRLMLACMDIVFPAVPRASNDAVMETAFGKRATLVRANPVDGLDDSINCI